MIVTIFFLIAGAVCAWWFDQNILVKRRPTIEVGGPTLIKALKKSDRYATICQNQENHRNRLRNRSDADSNPVEQLRSGGDGGEVLRIDSRK